MKPLNVRFGTMGWSYDDWRGPFYEAGLPVARMLEQYSRVFSLVELDTTFYGAPRRSVLDGWAAQTPDNFLFSAKVPRTITHERRLQGVAEAAVEFGALLRKGLGAKLGALLLQLAPDFSTEERDSLDAFIKDVTSTRREPGLPWVVEFRHASWADSDILESLAAQGVLAATTERLDIGAPLRYLRLLGTENSVARFDTRLFDRSQEIALWAERIKAAQADSDSPVLVLVRNFFEGHAPATLFSLMEQLGMAPPTPPGQQQMSLF